MQERYDMYQIIKFIPFCILLTGCGMIPSTTNITGASSSIVRDTTRMEDPHVKNNKYKVTIGKPEDVSNINLLSKPQPLQNPVKKEDKKKTGPCWLGGCK